jgi:hypothetical protein
MDGFEVSTVCGGVPPRCPFNPPKVTAGHTAKATGFCARMWQQQRLRTLVESCSDCACRQSPDRPRSASRRPKMQLRYRKMALLCSKTPPCCSKAHRTRISQGRPHDSTEQSKSNIQSTRLVNGASGLATKCVGAADDLLHPGAKSRQAGQNVAQKTVSTAR